MEATAEAVMVVYSSYSLQALGEIKIWSAEKTNTVEAEVTDDNTPVVAVVEAIARLSAEKADCRGFGYCCEGCDLWRRGFFYEGRYLCTICEVLLGLSLRRKLRQN